MTNTTMKSKEVSPSTRRTSVPTSFTNKIAVHPQWMKTLEEKYQKLHLKITRNASFMNKMQNSSNSRNYYDSQPNTGSRAVYNRLRADKVAEKYKNEYGNKLSNTDSNFSKSKIYATETSEPVTINLKAVDDHDNGHFSRSSVITEDENENIISKDQCESIVHSNEDKTGMVSEKELARRRNTLNDSSRLIEESERYRSQPLYKPKLIKNVHVVQPINAHNKLYKRDIVIKREYACKTSTSRYSNNTQKTTKSCPATMEKTSRAESSRLMPRQCISACVHSPRNNPPMKRRLKSFIGMSMEAQHAMTETIKAIEPEVAKEKDNSLPGDLDHTKGYFKDEEEGDYEENGNENLNWNYVAYDNNVNNDTYTGEAFSDSELSFSTRTRPHTSKTHRMRLPAISPDQRPYESLSNLQRLEHFRCRLPGIGNYDIPLYKENTFEITPPGFDIRYKDIPVYEQGESETPPPEIKDRAVQKCQEWLSRFTPR